MKTKVIDGLVLVRHSARLKVLIEEADVLVEPSFPYHAFTKSYRKDNNLAGFKLVPCNVGDWRDAERLFKKGLTSCDIWELLSFGREFPEMQLQFDIGALLSMTTANLQGDLIAALSHNEMCRRTLIMRSFSSETHTFGPRTIQKSFYLLARDLTQDERLDGEIPESGFLC